MLLFIFIVLGLVLVPDTVYAWGPLTHIYLGSKVLSVGSLLPAAVSNLLLNYRDDYLYGNIMADIILAKRYLPLTESSHSWQTAFKLMDSAETPGQRAFVYGYLSHLAADTAVHGIPYDRVSTHAFLELKSDGMMERRYWLMAIRIDRQVQKRNDLFLERKLKSPLISVKTSRKIFKGMVFLAGLTPKRLSLISDKRLSLDGLSDHRYIQELHALSMERIIDILRKGECSRVIGLSPVC